MPTATQNTHYTDICVFLQVNPVFLFWFFTQNPPNVLVCIYFTRFMIAQALRAMPGWSGHRSKLLVDNSQSIRIRCRGHRKTRNLEKSLFVREACFCAAAGRTKITQWNNSINDDIHQITWSSVTSTQMVKSHLSRLPLNNKEIWKKNTKNRTQFDHSHWERKPRDFDQVPDEVVRRSFAQIQNPFLRHLRWWCSATDEAWT